MLTGCSGCKNKESYTIPHYNTENEEEQVPTEEVSLEQNSNLVDDSEYVYDDAVSSVEYRPGAVYVPCGMSLHDAFLTAYPEMRNYGYKPYLGGPKLIAEMSADVDGINTSRPNRDTVIEISPLHVIKLRICDAFPDMLYQLVRKDIIIIDDCNIGSSLFSKYSFNVEIQIRNNTDEEVDVTVPQGQMIESVKENAQNIVVAEEKQVVLQPYEKRVIRVPAMCAARRRSDPSGSKGRITPYVLTAPPNAYQSKYSVWSYIEEPANRRMVFYAWGPGPLANGHKSKAGHAFAYIPEAGYLGFGSAHGDWTDDEGVISNHKRQVRYAEDSCVVWITGTQLQNVHDKLKLLYMNTPRYHVTYYDCTSFTMDIADAAGIYYGYRMPWRTPMGFIEELKKRN